MGRFGNSRLRLRKTGSGLATHLITRYASRMNDKPDAENTNDCIIPPEVPKTELQNLVSEQSEHEVREIVDYIEWQCNKKREHELRSEEHTSELQSLMRISYAALWLKNKTYTTSLTQI